MNLVAFANTVLSGPRRPHQGQYVKSGYCTSCRQKTDEVVQDDSFDHAFGTHHAYHTGSECCDAEVVGSLCECCDRQECAEGDECPYTKGMQQLADVTEGMADRLERIAQL